MTGALVRVLGRAELVLAGRPATPLRGPSRDLLGFLALSPDRPQRRESIVEHVWQHDDATSGRKLLRNALWQIHRDLDEAPGAHDALVTGRDWIELRSDGGVAFDIWDLDAAYQTAKQLGGAPTAPELAALERAVDSYRGDFLEEAEHTWCVVAKERYRLIHVTILERLVVEMTKARRLLQAQAHCQRLLSIDRAHEWAHRQLIELLFLAGDRTGALRQYDSCCRALHEEFGIAPSEATTALVRQVRDGNTGEPAPRSGPAGEQTLGEWLVELRQRLVELGQVVDARIQAQDT